MHRAMKRIFSLNVSAVALQRFNLIATFMWIAVVPVTLESSLKTSVTFLVFISIYANIVGHFSSYAAGRVEVRQEEIEAAP